MKAKRTEHAILGKSEALYISVYDNRDLGELYWGRDLGELYWGGDAYLIGGINCCDWNNLVLAGAIMHPGIAPCWASDIYKVKVGR